MLKIVKIYQRFSMKCCINVQNNGIKLPTQYCQVRNLHFTTNRLSKDGKSNDNDNINPVIASKYEIFTDNTTTIILDMEEERDRILTGESEEIQDTLPNIFDGLNTERGKTGVFDIEDLVAVLKRDNADNIFVCTVPKHLKYVDYLVVITARSHRHMKAIAEFVRKMYKIKRGKHDIIPKIEGKNSEEWMAMDMGNIALHIFSANVRKQYDLEMLWSVGPEYDTESNKPSDPIFSLFDQHSIVYGEDSPTDDTDNSNSKINQNIDEFNTTNDVKFSGSETK